MRLKSKVLQALTKSLELLAPWADCESIAATLAQCGNEAVSQSAEARN